jgi:hypothetical protein
MTARAILFDIDNVLSQTDKVIRAIIRECANVDLRYKDIVEFHYWDCEDYQGRRLSKSQWHEIHLEFTRNWLNVVEPYPNVAEHLRSIGQLFEIHLATSRLPEGHSATIAWLRTHSIPYTEMLPGASPATIVRPSNGAAQETMGPSAVSKYQTS